MGRTRWWIQAATALILAAMPTLVWSLDQAPVAQAAPSVNIVKTTLPKATVGVRYKARLQAQGCEGKSVVWIKHDWRGVPGLAFYRKIGAFVGVPTKVGDFPMIFKVRCYKEYDFSPTTTITVPVRQHKAPVITTDSLDDGTTGEPYDVTLSADGGLPQPQQTEPTYTWSIVPGTGSLPRGLKLNPHTGEITGTPYPHADCDSPYDFGIQVADGWHATSDEADFEINIWGSSSC